MDFPSSACYSCAVTATDKAFELLALISAAPRPQRLLDVVKASGLKQATVRRSLVGLARQGLVRQDARKAYLPGLHILDLAAVALDRMDFAAEAEGALRALSVDVPGTITLALYRDRQLSIASTLASSEPYRVAGRGIESTGFHATAAGKAIIAHLPPPDVGWLLGPGPLPRYTPHTITAVEVLLQELAHVAARGFAINDQESRIGVRCLAAPIWNHLAHPMGAVTVTVAASQCTVDELIPSAAVVRSAAAAISSSMGGLPPARFSQHNDAPFISQNANDR